jgi:hypothetical protein
MKHQVLRYERKLILQTYWQANITAELLEKNAVWEHHQQHDTGKFYITL